MAEIEKASEPTRPPGSFSAHEFAKNHNPPMTREAATVMLERFERHKKIKSQRVQGRVYWTIL